MCVINVFYEIHRAIDSNNIEMEKCFILTVLRFWLPFIIIASIYLLSIFRIYKMHVIKALNTLLFLNVHIFFETFVHCSFQIDVLANKHCVLVDSNCNSVQVLQIKLIYNRMNITGQIDDLFNCIIDCQKNVEKKKNTNNAK